MVETSLAKTGLLPHEPWSSVTRPRPKSRAPFSWASNLSVYSWGGNNLTSDSGLPSNPTKNPNGLIHPLHKCWSSEVLWLRGIQWLPKVKTLAFTLRACSCTWQESWFLPPFLPLSFCPSLSSSLFLNRQTPGNLPDQEGCTVRLTPLRANQHCSRWVCGLKLTSLAFWSQRTWSASYFWK